MIKVLNLLWVLVILTGCQSEKSKIGDVPVIDLSKNYPKKEVRLQDIADVEYIPLETTDDVLLGRASLISYVSDKYIVTDDGMNTIFIFNRKGEIVSHFNQAGQGPQEYVKLGFFLFDEKNEEIIVFQGFDSRFLVYSTNGEFKRTFKYPKEWIISRIYNFDDETMLVYNDDRSIMDNNYSEKPYILLSKKDGSIVSILDIRMPVRYTDRVSQEIDMGGGQKGTTASYIYTPNNPYYGEDLVIANISSDTIYRLTPDRKLIPILSHTPSVHALDPPIVWGVPLVTDKFIILCKTILDGIAHEQGRDIPSEYLMYEFETGQTYKVSFEDVDLHPKVRKNWFPFLGGISIDCPKNTLVQILPEITLRYYYKEKLAKGEVKKVPDEEDNPIVAIYTFK